MTIPTIGAYLLLVFFFVFEGLVRQGQAARSLERGEHDRRSTGSIGPAFMLGGACMLLAPVLNFLNIGNVVPPIVALAGVLLAAGGLGLRLWAPRVLGRFYTRTLRVADQQTVVDQGPYRLIRHPGYAGALAVWVGAGLATGNVLATIVIAVAMFVAYSYRIQAEERMLVATVGQPYRDYQARTRRLIPFVY
jgi:protein-S-isoprenylcysteine O-methyltransferase Ste14